MTNSSCDICVIEDDASQRNLLCAQLREQGFSVGEAGDGIAGIQLIYQLRPRIVISDLRLPGLDGIQICRRVRTDPTLDGVYFLMATADQSPGAKTAALNAGADDFLLKPINHVELRARLRNGMRFHRLQERLRKAALTDGLTELWNHTQFRHLLDREFARTRRYGGSVALLLIDLDHFKAINDTYGHETGNVVLRLSSQHFARSVRDTDLVARYGGEEFAVICPQTSLDEAYQLAERLRITLADSIQLAQHPQLSVRASLGVATSDDPGVTCVADLIALADRALYVGKRTGRDRVVRSDELRGVTVVPEQSMEELDRLRKEVFSLSMQSKELCLQSIWSLIQALDARDQYSAWHSRSVTQYVRWMTEAAAWPTALRTACANAAMLHDLGKIGLSDELLNQSRPLTDEERKRVRDVPQTTCKILEPLRVFEIEIQIIRHVRENFDGSGAPDGLRAAEIPMGSRLLAVAEAFDSLTCGQAGRSSLSREDAVRHLQQSAGTQFDPQYVDLLERLALEDAAKWQAQIDRARSRDPGEWSPRELRKPANSDRGSARKPLSA